MRKQKKKKLRSCPLCKPHKTCGANRWKAKEKQAMDLADKEIRNYDF